MPTSAVVLIAYLLWTSASSLCLGKRLEDAMPCPRGCSCDAPPEPSTGCHYSTLSISCLQSRPRDGFTAEFLQLLTWNNFTVFSNLVSLEITNTPLKVVPALVCNLTSLLDLQLDRNLLTALPAFGCLQNVPNLRTFSASYNNITALSKGTFRGLRNLRRLELRNNAIASLDYDAFVASAGLDKLMYIDLSYNLLPSLDVWPIDRGLVGSPGNQVIIDLNHNKISRFTNVAGNNILKHCGRQNRSHVIINLAFNNFRRVSDVLIGYNVTLSAALACLFLDPYTPIVESGLKVRLHNYGYDCSCKDFQYFKLNSKAYGSKPLREMFCGSPPELDGMEINRVPLERFVCDIAELCPFGCRCFTQPSNLTVHVVCSDSNLTSLPERLPKLTKTNYKYRLVFARCRQLRLIERRDYFEQTNELDVTWTPIEGVSGDDDVWNDLLRIPIVLLARTSLQRLPALVGSINSSTLKLTLGNNDWICSCENSWMIEWMKSLGSRLADADDVICNRPSRLRGRELLTATSDDFCVDPVIRTSAIAGASLAFTFLVVVVVVATAYRFRVALFTRWKLHPFDRDQCKGERLNYDVFLSASDGHDEVLARNLVETLETRGYRVCYGPRDFVGGSYVATGCLAITRSKRTVCLLTDSYIKSSTCLFEFDFALHHNLIQLRKKRLVVLTTLNNPTVAIGDTAELTDDQVRNEENRKQFDVNLLRQYLRQYPYIKLNCDGWLDRLLYCLPIIGIYATRRPEDSDHEMDNEALFTP